MTTPLYYIRSYTWCTGEPTYNIDAASLDKSKLIHFLKAQSYRKAERGTYQSEELQRTAYIEETTLL